MLAAHLPNRNARVDLPKGIRYLLHRESRLSHRLVLSKVSSEANSRHCGAAQTSTPRTTSFSRSVLTFSHVVLESISGIRALSTSAK